MDFVNVRRLGRSRVTIKSMLKATERPPRRVLDKATCKTTVKPMRSATRNAVRRATEQRRLRVTDKPTRRAAVHVMRRIRRPKLARQPQTVPRRLRLRPRRTRTVYRRSWLTAPAQQTPVHSDRPAAAVGDSVGRVVVVRAQAHAPALWAVEGRREPVGPADRVAGEVEAAAVDARAAAVSAVVMALSSTYRSITAGILWTPCA